MKFSPQLSPPRASWMTRGQLGWGWGWSILVTRTCTYTITARHCTYICMSMFLCSIWELCIIYIIQLLDFEIVTQSRFVNCVEHLCSVFTQPPCDSSYVAENSWSWPCFLLCGSLQGVLLSWSLCYFVTNILSEELRYVPKPKNRAMYPLMLNIHNHIDTTHKAL